MAFDLSSLFSGPSLAPQSSGLMGMFGGNPQTQTAQQMIAAGQPRYLGQPAPPMLPMQAGGSLAPGAMRIGALSMPGGPGNPVLTTPRGGQAQLPLAPGSLPGLSSSPGAAMNPLLAAALRARLGKDAGAPPLSANPGDAQSSDLMDMLMGRLQYAGLF